MAKIRELSKGDLRSTTTNPEERVYPVTIGKAVYVNTPETVNVTSENISREYQNKQLDIVINNKVGDIDFYYIPSEYSGDDNYFVVCTPFQNSTIKDIFTSNFSTPKISKLVTTSNMEEYMDSQPLVEALRAIKPGTSSAVAQVLSITSDLANNSPRTALSAQAGNNLQSQIDDLIAQVRRLENTFYNPIELTLSDDVATLNILTDDNVTAYLDCSVYGNKFTLKNNTPGYIMLTGHNLTGDIMVNMENDDFIFEVYQNVEEPGAKLTTEGNMIQIPQSTINSHTILIKLTPNGEGYVKGTLSIVSCGNPKDFEDKMLTITHTLDVVAPDTPTIDTTQFAKRVVFDTSNVHKNEALEVSLDGGKTWVKTNGTLTLRNDRNYNILSRVVNNTGRSSLIKKTIIHNG